MKLREKIILPIGLILLIGMSTISIVLFFQSRSVVKNGIVREMSQVSEMLIRDLDGYQTSSLLDVEIFSNNNSFKQIFSNKTPELVSEINQELLMIKKQKKEYENIGLTDETGLVIACSDVELIGKVSVAERDYFNNAIKGNSGSGEVVLSKVTENPIFGSASPIVIDGVIRGTLFAIIDLTHFNSEFIDPVRIGESGYAFMTDSEGNVIAYPDKKMILNLDFKDFDFGREIMAMKNGYYTYRFKGMSKVSSFKSSELSGWMITLTVEESDIFSGINRLLKFSIFITFISILVGLIVIILISRSIVKPIKMNSEYANSLASGNLSIQFDHDLLRSKDESGDLAKSFYKVIEKLNIVVKEVKRSSQQVARGSQQLSNTAEQISHGATEQASTAEEVSSSMEEISTSIRQNTESASQTEKMASKASDDAEIGGAAVMEAVEAMNQIANKIQVIEDIARRTNMLSLNAAIEAARAGDHGKGFAVVASEVRKLATNSQSAAKEILALAKTSVEKANDAGVKINAIIPDIRNTADLVKEISVISREQDSGAEQVNQVMVQLDQVIQMNASAAEESAAMSEELSSQADKLSEMIDFFTVSDGINPEENE